mgnify:CR=1 FL=1
MNARPSDPARLVALSAILLWIGLFTLACEWTGTAAPAASGDSVARVFGSLRQLSARHTLAEADRYFHRGIGAVREAGFDDPLQRLRGQLSPNLHEHLEPTEAQELMPWLRWTVAANPSDVETWLIAAFWLDHGLERIDLALAVCREAAAANPDDYRPYLQWARLLLRDGAWGPAGRVCDRALALWPARLEAGDPDAELDRARLLEWRGYLYAFSGDRSRAEETLLAAVSLRPDHQGVQEELQRIRSGAALTGVVGPGLRRLRGAAESLRPMFDTLDHDEDHD